MRMSTVRADGSLKLGNEAQRAGYGPFTVVQITVLSSGSLLVSTRDVNEYPLRELPMYQPRESDRGMRPRTTSKKRS